MRIDTSRPFSFFIDLPVRNEWKNIDLVRTSVQNCFQAVFVDIDGCNALAMVTGELLENAMKYGAWKQGQNPIAFRLRVKGDGEGTTVSVQNPVRTDDPSVRALQDTLSWINGFANAEEAYRARLLEIANASSGEDSSGLGLVRVAYEGGCHLTATVENDVLTVVAEIRR